MQGVYKRKKIIITCVCGEKFMGVPRSIYCDECKRNNPYKEENKLNHIIKCNRCGELFEGKTLGRNFCNNCIQKKGQEMARNRKNVLRALEGKPPLKPGKPYKKEIDIKCTLIHYTGDYDRYKKEIWGE